MISVLWRATGKAAVFLMTVLVLSALVFGADIPTVSAAGGGTSASVDQVNLKKDKWVYSLYHDKNKSRYAAITRYDGDDLEVAIPAEFDGLPVRTISREAFCDNKYMTSVEIPETVTDIGKYAFSGCIGLAHVTFPASLKNIGEGAFYGCWSLTEAGFSGKLEKIGSFSFYNCRHLTKVSFPSSLKSIGNSTFEGCAMLEAIAFDGGPETIGDTAFKGCASLKKADLSGVKRLGTGAFMKCVNLETVVCGDEITDIRPETFRGCVSLRKIAFGDRLKSIETSAFEECETLSALPAVETLEKIGPLAFTGCASLKKAEFGESLSEIGFCAFRDCVSLASMTVSDKNEVFSSVNGCLYSKDGTRLILCPQGFKGKISLRGKTGTVGDYAAAGCLSVKEVSLGENTSEIGRGAFLGCTDIAFLSIPDSVERIGSAAFGVYLNNGEWKKENYFRAYGAEGGMADSYCAQREMRFLPYSGTLYAGSQRVVLEENGSIKLICGFSSEKKGTISWETSDESVVRVKDGKLTAVSQGNAEVTASAEGFNAAVVKVSVVPAREKHEAKNKTSDSHLVYCGEQEELSSLFSQLIDPIFASDRFWYSSSPAVASVDNDGNVSAHNSGTAKIVCHMPDGSENIIPVTVTEKPAELSLEAPQDELLIGKSVRIKKRMVPSYSSDIITWESDNENIAKVDAEGWITAAGQGNCTVTALSASGLKSSVSVTCVIPADDISLDMEARNVYQGKEFNLTATLAPDNSEQRILWRSSDPTVASVNSKGKVTGKSFGTAVIYAETSSGLAVSCTVNVLAKAEELDLDTKNLSLNCGTSHKLGALIRPSYSPETTDRCTWNSTDESIAVVDEDGNVTAVSPGRCIINCRTSGDLISKCRVQVSLPAESVEINSEKDTLYIGEVVQLKAVTTPHDTTDKVEWSCEDSGVVRVTSNGTVKALSPGTALITVKLTNEISGSSVSSTFEVTVLKKAESVKLSSNSLSMRQGENDFLTYTILPDDSNDTVTWSSSDESVASVRDDGLITAIAPGICYIRIETGSGSAARCKVTVTGLN